MKNKIEKEYQSALRSLQLEEAKCLIHFLAGYAMGIDKEKMVKEMIIKQVNEIRERGS